LIEKDYKKMKAFYLKGFKPRQILEKFPEINITAKELSQKLSRDNAAKKKKKIDKKVEENLINDIINEQTYANKELIKVSKQIIEVAKMYFEKEQYRDFAGFNYGKMLKTRSNTLNTYAFNQVVKAISEAQKIQRLALGMDKEELENLKAPVINIDLGELNETSGD
ncbi:MAG: hypothetical protein LUH11_03420, partial [Candidatus Gastranaerophilales bacterium]|nr:hypothetical protein [Candidatus Gastranaerophilales bacterium]